MMKERMKRVGGRWMAGAWDRERAEGLFENNVMRRKGKEWVVDESLDEHFRA